MSILGESGYERKDLDSYRTPLWATLWAIESGLLRTPKQGVVWEPAAGVGHMSNVFLAKGYDVLSTDVHNHGWDKLDGVVDFMSVPAIDPAISLIATNPPYDIQGQPGVPDVTAEEFIRHALALAKPVGAQVLMLLRHEYDCAKGRRDLFDGPPFRAKMNLSRRPKWVDETMPTKSGKEHSPRFNFAYYLWDWGYEGRPELVILPRLSAAA